MIAPRVKSEEWVEDICPLCKQKFSTEILEDYSQFIVPEGHDDDVSERRECLDCRYHLYD